MQTLALNLISQIRNQFPLLAAVEDRLSEAVQSQSKVMTRLAQYTARSGGKRIRPMLVALSAASFSPHNEALLDVATAAELIHIASLVHDDVIDHASERRGNVTLNKISGNHAAVLTGDYLFASAYALLTKHHRYGVLEVMTHAIRCMCEGEIEQGKSLFCCNRTENEYFRHIEKKTASLLAASCEAGASVGGASLEQQVAMRNFGLYLGYAFQITDDILDILGDEKVIGKPAGQDLRQGVITLPVLRLLSGPNAPDVQRIIDKRVLSDGDINFVQTLALEQGTIESSYKSAEESLEKAKQSLDHAGVSSTEKNLLLELADLILRRRM